MGDKKYSENDPERTLITLDQLSQTIEVMTSVVNRLRQHLSEQISAKRELEQLAREKTEAAARESSEQQRTQGAGFVVEITQPVGDEPEPREDKTLH